MSERAPSPERKKEGPRERFASQARDLLKQENFIISHKHGEYFRNELSDSDRFVSAVGMRQEKSGKRQRFLKFPVSPEINRDADKDFFRQIEITKFLAENSDVKIRKIISSNTNRKEGVPYAVLETWSESDARVGFVSSIEGGELLGKKEAQSTIEELQKLHDADTSRLPPQLRRLLRELPRTYEDFIGEITDIVDQKAKPQDSRRLPKREPLHKALSRHTEIAAFRNKVMQLMEKWEDVIQRHENGKEILVHGDLGPGHLFLDDESQVEFLDYDEAGVTDNEVLGTIIDTGNFRARAWNNPKFREAFDKAIIKHYKDQGDEEKGRAIVSLGILRSHMILAGFFENYPLPKQREEEQARRRESTETDLRKAWEVAGLEI